MVTLLTESKEIVLADARMEGEGLWLSAWQLEAATGWSAGPDGLCRESVCVPIPPGREAELVRGDTVNVAAVWRHLGKPVLHSDDGTAWVLGEAAGERAAALRSLQAPDFTLPDVSGRLHALSDHRGKKVLLVSWASW